MVGLLLKFLPGEKRTLIEMVDCLYEALDDAEKKDMAEHCRKILADGKIGLTEWSTFGKKLGVFRFGK